MRFSVLGIGTELTSGQILNRNAQWISGELKKAGLETSVHLCVPDETDLIIEALQFCQRTSDVIFITGGLGPTTDDFTRDMVAQFTGLKMNFDEGSWTHIQNRLNARGVPLRDAQKQQCYFPAGAKILSNREGTANAFAIKHEKLELIVLPGPPKEIAAIWEDHLTERVTAWSQQVDRLVTRSWTCRGMGESEISFRVENVLKGSFVEKGYRVHYPYVEVKLTYRQSQQELAEPWIKAVDDALYDLALSCENSLLLPRI